MPFEEDSPAPRRAEMILPRPATSPAVPSPRTPRNKKRQSKPAPIHVHADSIDSLDEPFWSEDVQVRAPQPPQTAKTVQHRPSLADLTNSVGILGSQRGRLAYVKSTPALRIGRGRTGSSPTKVALAPARTATEQLDLAQVISSSVPLDATLPNSGHRRDASADSLSSLESLVDLIVGEKAEKETLFTPSSPEVRRIVERQWSELLAKDQRERDRRRSVQPSPSIPVVATMPPSPVYEVFVEDRPPPVVRHTTSTPALRLKPSLSTLATRKEPKLLRSAASLAALRPIVSPANGEILANGSARIVNDPTPLRRRQQTSREVTVPPKVQRTPAAPTPNRTEPAIVSFPNAEEVAERLNAAMRARKRQRKWWNDWIAFGPAAAKAKEPSASGAKTALRELLGEARPPLSRVPSFELAPRITVSEGSA